MNINRRKFLLSATAIIAAPAIVKAENLMKIWTPKHIDQPGVYKVPLTAEELAGDIVTISIRHMLPFINVNDTFTITGDGMMYKVVNVDYGKMLCGIKQVRQELVYE